MTVRWPVWLPLLTGLAASGCGGAAADLGDSTADARVHADQMLYALAVRFGPAIGAPGWEDRRAKIGGSALVPSRLYADSSVWTRFGGDSRELRYSGSMTPRGYVLGLPESGMPSGPGEYRRVTRLRDFGDREYQWEITDELALGSVAPAEIVSLFRALLRTAESSDGDAIIRAYRASLPRTTTALGRLFAVDSVATSSVGRGSLVTLVTTIDPDRIAAEYPAFSRYLNRYISPARVDLVVRNERGSVLWRGRIEREVFTFTVRVENGRLVPLDGSSGAPAGDLLVRLDIATRVRIFGVGASALVGNVAFGGEGPDRSFAVRFQDEPEWHLPPLVERLLRTSLGRPFEDEGMLLRYSLRRSGARTMVSREYAIAVQESAILRWLGSLGSTAFGDFRGAAEREYDRFNGELFTAMRADLARLLR